MRWFVSAILIAGCSFEHGNPVGDDDAAVGFDVPADLAADMAAPKFCATDSHLLLCYSFDQDPLPASLPNEGAANVSAALMNVTRGDHAGGGAAEVTAASSIYVPETTAVAGIQTFEISFRVDTAPAANFARIGVLDSNIIPPNISLFLYRVDPGYQLRCGLGGALYTYDAPGLQLAVWHRVVCTCNADTLQVFVDGAKIGETPNAMCASGGAIVSSGMTIGANNNGGPSGVDEWVVGAVDGVRLWDSTQLQLTSRP